MTISREVFREQISRLERQFNGGKELDELVQEEYFMTMTLFTEPNLIKAVDNVVQTHRPYTGHIFPSISTILDALNDVMRTAGPDPETQSEPDFCEQCRNVGIYSVGEKARFCDCMKGRRKEMDFRFWPDKKRAEEEKNKIKSAASPHRGLREFNPHGFWEETQEEHDKFMTTERTKIDEIDARKARRRELDGVQQGNAPTGLLGAVKGALAHVIEARKSIKELEEEKKLDAEASLL